MNCQQLFSGIGFGCTRLETEGGTDVFQISTPFQFADGNALPVFVEHDDPLLRFFDAGETLFQLLGSGIHLRDGRALAPVRKVVEEFGASLNDDGDIELITPPQYAREAFGHYVRAVMAVADWEKEHVGLPPGAASLAAEAENYLAMWKPNAHILRRQSLEGLSGRPHEFALLIDDEYIDVIPSRPQSTGAELRKLFDVRKSALNDGVKIRVIVDDRQNKERAKEEASIIGGLAIAWTMSDLITAAATGPSTHRHS